MSTGMLFRGEHLPLQRGDNSETRPHIHAMTQTDQITAPAPKADPEEMAGNAAMAASYLKSLGHEGRLMILCHLCQGEKTVGELEALLNMRQASVSQLLARLREDEQVAARRDGKLVYYSLADTRTEQVIGLLYTLFCAPQNG